jgi:hypothetical protein
VREPVGMAAAVPGGADAVQAGGVGQASGLSSRTLDS